MYLLIALACALGFRVRGGLKLYKDKKFPLNKWWFAAWFACLSCILKGWSWQFWITGFIASKMCTSISGWGTYIGALYTGHISDTDKDDLNITDFVQNKLFPLFKKNYKDYPKLYGFLALSLRGGLTTFILGLWLNSFLYMLVGLLQGSVYWLGGWTCRHIYNDGKYGWKISEIFWGSILGIFLIILG